MEWILSWFIKDKLFQKEICNFIRHIPNYENCNKSFLSSKPISFSIVLCRYVCFYNILCYETRSNNFCLLKRDDFFMQDHACFLNENSAFWRHMFGIHYFTYDLLNYYGIFIFFYLIQIEKLFYNFFLKDPVTTHDIWKLAKFQKLQEGERERMYFKIYVRKPNPVRLVKVFVFTGHVWKRACCCYCQLLLLILTKFLLNI